MKKLKITEMAGIGLKDEDGKPINDDVSQKILESNFNVEKCSSMSFEEFSAIMKSWSEPREYKAKDGSVKMTIPKVIPPTDAEIRSVYKKVTGNDPKVQTEKTEKK